MSLDEKRMNVSIRIEMTFVVLGVGNELCFAEGVNRGFLEGKAEGRHSRWMRVHHLRPQLLPD